MQYIYQIYDLNISDCRSQSLLSFWLLTSWIPRELTEYGLTAKRRWKSGPLVYVHTLKAVNEDQSPLENRNLRTKLALYIRTMSDRIKYIKSTHDDTRSFNQPKRKTNKPFMIDEPSNQFTRKWIRRNTKTIEWINGNNQVTCVIPNKPPPSLSVQISITTLSVQISTTTIHVCTKDTQKDTESWQNISSSKTLHPC